MQEKEKKYAAKTGLNSKVRVAKEKIDEYNQVKARFEAQKKDNEEKLEDIRQTLGQVDTSLRTLRPSLKLDSLNDRCECGERTSCHNVSPRAGQEWQTCCHNVRPRAGQEWQTNCHNVRPRARQEWQSNCHNVRPLAGQKWQSNCHNVRPGTGEEWQTVTMSGHGLATFIRCLVFLCRYREKSTERASL